MTTGRINQVSIFSGLLYEPISETLGVRECTLKRLAVISSLHLFLSNTPKKSLGLFWSFYPVLPSTFLVSTAIPAPQLARIVISLRLIGTFS